MEIEAKFQVSDQQVLDDIAKAAELAGFPLSVAVRQRVTDVYLDTASGSVSAAGYTLRRRLTPAGALVTLKQTGKAVDGVHRREELEVEVPPEVPWSEWPEGSVRDKLTAMIGDEPLQEVLTLRQVRAVRRVGPPRRGVAELSLDHVRLEVHTGTGSAETGEVERYVFLEVEAELKPYGTEEDLAAIAAELRDRWSLIPQPLSKFARAWALSHPGEEGMTLGAIHTGGALEAGPSDKGPKPAKGQVKRGGPKRRKAERFLGDGLPVLEKPGIDVRDTMAQAADKTLLYHLQQMMRHEPGTRTGKDPEDLHDMRVATRRMRAAVRVFGDYVDAKSLKPYLKMMRQTGRTLGAVRDLDVFRIKAQAYIEALPPSRRSELDPLLAAWEQERDRSRDILVSFLDQARYQSFKEEFEVFLRSNGVGDKRRASVAGEPTPTLVRDVLPQIVFERLAEVRAYDEEMLSGTAPLVRYHQLRIAMKSLRYTLEFFQEVLGPKVKPLIDITKQVQDHLGDLQDASVTCEVLLGFLASGTWEQGKRKLTTDIPVNAPGVAVYLVAKQKEIERLMRTFKPVWRRIRGPQFSRRLASLVGAL